MISKILCKGLEPYYPMFVEEAMWGQDGAEGTEAWRELSDSTTVPLATGEREPSLGCGPRSPGRAQRCRCCGQGCTRAGSSRT